MYIKLIKRGCILLALLGTHLMVVVVSLVPTYNNLLSGFHLSWAFYLKVSNLLLEHVVLYCVLVTRQLLDN